MPLHAFTHFKNEQLWVGAEVNIAAGPHPNRGTLSEVVRIGIWRAGAQFVIVRKQWHAALQIARELSSFINGPRVLSQCEGDVFVKSANLCDVLSIRDDRDDP